MRVLEAQGNTNKFIKPTLRWYSYVDDCGADDRGDGYGGLAGRRCKLWVDPGGVEITTTPVSQTLIL